MVQYIKTHNCEKYHASNGYPTIDDAGQTIKVLRFASWKCGEISVNIPLLDIIIK